MQGPDSQIGGASSGSIARQGARLAVQVDVLRKSQHLSRRQLADRAGIGVTTVRKILKGEGNPTLDTLLALANVLGLHSIEELFGPLPSHEILSKRD